MAKGKKTGGRKPGSKNKSKTVEQLRYALPALGFDLSKELIDLFRNKETDVQTKVKLLSLFIQYTQVGPTLEQVEREKEEEDAPNLSAVPAQPSATLIAIKANVRKSDKE